MFAPLAEFIGRVSDRKSSTAVLALDIFIFFGLLDAAVDRLTLRANVNPDVHTTLEAQPWD
jgi:hypothetical protein